MLTRETVEEIERNMDAWLAFAGVGATVRGLTADWLAMHDRLARIEKAAREHGTTWSGSDAVSIALALSFLRKIANGEV
jgi:hypothetical protein